LTSAGNGASQTALSAAKTFTRLNIKSVIKVMAAILT
jgi:hypothetical protein